MSKPSNNCPRDEQFWLWGQNFLPWVFIELWNVINIISSVNTDVLVQRSFVQHSTIWAPGKTQQDPGDLLGTNPFPVSHLWVIGNRLHSASLTFPEIKGQIQTVANQGRVAETREVARNNSAAALGQGPDFPSRNIQNNVSLSSSAGTVPPPRWRMVTAVVLV